MGRWFLGFCALGLALTATASTAPETRPAPQLLLRIVVMRHGVRSPTSAPGELAPYAHRPWAEWPVAPGMLTSHGAQGMTALGQRYRQSFGDAGLWSGRCGTLDKVVVIADSTPRNRASAAALVQGLAPSCHGHYLALAADQSNPLFHFGESKDAKEDDGAPSSIPTPWPPDALRLLQRVLLDCSGDACLAQAKTAGRKLLVDPAHADDAARAKSLKTAGSLSENLMLEYAQGLPMAQVAWGAGDGDTIGQLITLHNLQFALSKKSMPAAVQAGSNLMAHILATLQQGSGATPVVAPLSDRHAKVVILLGHDTNLANLAGMLGLDWHDARQPDDYPPGGALVFDLLDDHGQYTVRVATAMPTLDALRRADFSQEEALVRHTLSLPACPRQSTCPLPVVSHWLGSRLDPQRIEEAIPVMPINMP